MIHESYKQFSRRKSMKDGNTNLKPSWEEVRGLSWLFVENNSETS